MLNDPFFLHAASPVQCFLQAAFVECTGATVPATQWDKDCGGLLGV